VTEVAVIDYGGGNIASVVNALWRAGADPKVVARPEDIAKAERAVLPGVGAAGAALDRLRGRGIDTALDELRRAGRPLLGICVGMQVLADDLREFGSHRGLGWTRGQVVKLDNDPATGARVPHMGWSAIAPVGQGGGWFEESAASRYYYFCHSYKLTQDGAATIATADHAGRFSAAVAFDTVLAVQFHPEKSAMNGQRFLEKFLDWKP